MSQSETAPDKANTQGANGGWKEVDHIPANAVQTGDLYHGEPLGTKAAFSGPLRFAGYFISIMAGIFSREFVSVLFKENVITHEIAKGDSTLQAFQKSLNRSIDLKLWKSNLAEIGVMLGGFALTGHLIKRLEQKKFLKYHRPLPDMDRVDKIVRDEYVKLAKDSVTSQDTKWQDAAKGSAEQAGINSLSAR